MREEIAASLPSSPESAKMSQTLARAGAGDGLRAAPWRGLGDVAVLTTVAGHPPPDVAAVQRRLEALARAGVRQALTGALTQAEQGPYLAAGFTMHERLALLAHDLVDPPLVPALANDLSLRRARRRDRQAVLSIDRAAFDDFWHLDQAGLADAMAATGTARFRVVADGESPAAYAITGRSATRGYIQRLAVAPQHQRTGLATALVSDALAWSRRHRAGEVLVNTQVINQGALALYERLGFRRLEPGLAVLSRSIPPPGS